MTTVTASPAAVRQSLAHGPLGQALLLAERANLGTADPKEAHRILSTVGPLVDGPDAGLYFGAPAMAWTLHIAADGTDRYTQPQHTLDAVVNTHVEHRLAQAHARIDAGALPTFAEYDLLRGLTGLGVLLLHRQPHGPQTKAVLQYLVRLTHPLPGPHRDVVPGWWVNHSPTSKNDTPGGHANSSLSHGITGPLALLALAMRAGITVDGQEGAIRRICRWLDSLQTTRFHGMRWARSISAAGQTTPAPPSWCYGTPGIARAQQLAAIVTNDHDRKRMAERALMTHLADPAELARITTNGLCHGYAGILRTVQRVAQDATEPHARALRSIPLRKKLKDTQAPDSAGFLTGEAGVALTEETTDDTAPLGQWDSCLLLA